MQLTSLSLQPMFWGAWFELAGLCEDREMVNKRERVGGREGGMEGDGEKEGGWDGGREGGMEGSVRWRNAFRCPHI